MLPKEAEFAHPRGWPAKPNEAVQRIDVNYILPDMIAKAVNGMPTKRAMDVGAGPDGARGEGPAQGERLADGHRLPRARGGRRRGARPSRARARVVGAGARLRLRPDPAGARAHRLPRRLSVRDGHLLQPVGLLGGLARQLRRARRTSATSSATRSSARRSGTRSSSPPSPSCSRPCSACGWRCCSSRNLRFKRLIRGAVLLPWVIPTALSTLGVVVDVRLALQRGELDGRSAWGSSARRARTGSAWPTYAMAAVIAVNVWRGLPFFAITVLAGLVSIPREYYEAAEVDGAGSWRPLLPRHAAAAQAGAGRGDPLLDDLHVRRLQHRLRADPGRAGEHDAPLRHARLPGGAARAATSGRARPSRCSCSRCWGGGVLPAPLHPERVTMISRGSQRAAARLRSAAVRVRQPGAVRLLRAVSLLLHARHLVQDRTPSSTTSSRSRSGSRPASSPTTTATCSAGPSSSTWILNSLIISVAATSISLVISILAGVQPGPAALPRAWDRSAPPSSSRTWCRPRCCSCRCRRSWSGSASPTPSGR